MSDLIDDSFVSLNSITANRQETHIERVHVDLDIDAFNPEENLPTCFQICNLMFPCVQIAKIQRQNFEEELKMRNQLTQYYYQITSSTMMDTSLLKTTLVVEEKPIVSRNPQFVIGQHKIFIDVKDNEEYQVITSSSLPRNYDYFLPYSNVDNRKPLLCLDLDETLVSSKIKQTDTQGDFSISVVLENKREVQFSVTKRPYLDEFLQELSVHYDICVFTYSIQPYADQIIDIIDKEKVVQHRLFRKHCIRCNINEDNNRFFIVKDLTRVGRCLDEILLVDNSQKTGYWQENNFILCSSFLGDKTDNELIQLKNVILQLVTGDNKGVSIYQQLSQK